MALTNEKAMHFPDDGHIPNNPRLPVILYPGAFKTHPEEIEPVFNMNGWGNSWQDDVLTYHHYHSNAHEVLGVRSGNAVLQIGGEQGGTVEVEKGDVILLPAGTGHKKLEGSTNFQVVGAYPGGRSPNTKTGEAADRPFVLEDIRNVPLPDADPVFGKEGPLHKHWKG